MRVTRRRRSRRPRAAARASSRSPRSAAQCSAVMPSPCGALTSARSASSVRTRRDVAAHRGVGDAAIDWRAPARDRGDAAARAAAATAARSSGAFKHALHLVSSSLRPRIRDDLSPDPLRPTTTLNDVSAERPPVESPNCSMSVEPDHVHRASASRSPSACPPRRGECTLPRSLPLAPPSSDQRAALVVVDVAVAHRRAVDDQALVEQRRVAFLDRLQLLQEVGQQADVVPVDLRRTR